MMEVDGSVLTAVPDRRRMQRMQTPQGFRLETIVKAYRQAMADPHFRATDDCGVVMRYLPQTPIFIVPGDERAMKLTVPSDLPVLEQYLRSSDRQEQPRRRPYRQNSAQPNTSAISTSQPAATQTISPAQKIPNVTHSMVLPPSRLKSPVL